MSNHIKFWIVIVAVWLATPWAIIGWVHYMEFVFRVMK